MTEIANQYNGTKRKYFLEQLNDCTIDRFESLSTERGKVTITGVREAETMLQSKEYNNFDGRLRKGELSGEPNTLSKKYTDLDSKLFVSDNTLQYQADQKKLLGQKNPHKIEMEEQGKNLGFSGVKQKHKRCDQNKPELPSSSKNVRHIINLLELGQSEKSIAKDNLIESSRIGWAAQLNVAETSISDETALQGIIFLNEDYTIEDIK